MVLHFFFFKGQFNPMGCRISLEVIGKLLCLILLVLQGAILDYYLYEHHDYKSLGFIATDIAVVVIWISVMLMAKQKFLSKLKRMRRKTEKEKTDGRPKRPASDYADEIPYLFIAWLAYVSITLVPEVAVIFKRFADQLGDAKVWGQNILKIALCITPMLFLLMVNSHHDARPNSERRVSLDKISAGVTLDLLDSIDILEVLFLDDAELSLPVSLENAIIAFACINFFLPTLALLQLSTIAKGQANSTKAKVLYSVSYICLVNVPLGVIRVLLWVNYSQDVSVFIGKNLIASAIYMFDIYESCGPQQPEQGPTGENHFALEKIDGHETQCASALPENNASEMLVSTVA